MILPHNGRQSHLSSMDGVFRPGQGTVLLIMFIVSRIISSLDHNETPVVRRTPKIIRDEQDAKRYARKGFVGFAVLPNSPADMKAPARLEAAKRLDFKALLMDDVKSNWAPTIYGITSHASKLEHCWLIGTYTPGVDNSGSRPYIPVLVAYLQQCRGLKCQFHYGEEFDVPVDVDDSAIWDKAYERVRHILLDHAPKVELKPKDVVADITTAPRSMTLGMILSCLQKDRDIQMVGTHYDKDGKPIPPLFTLLYSFEPEKKE